MIISVSSDKNLRFSQLLGGAAGPIVVIDQFESTGDVNKMMFSTRSKTVEVCKGTFQKRFSRFCPLSGYPPPTPLTENHFAKKTLAERGGTPPPLNGKSPKIFLKKSVKKG